MTIQAARTRRFPYLMRRRLSRLGTANAGAFINECDIVVDGNDVRSNLDDVVVSNCNPIDIIVGTDEVVVGTFDVIVGT